MKSVSNIFVSKVSLCVVALLLVAMVAYSQQSSSFDSALETAQSFFKEKKVSRNNDSLICIPSSKIEQSLRLKSPERGQAVSGSADEGYYIFSDKINKKFVIVSAEENMPSVLCYSLENSFDTASMPETMHYLLTQLRRNGIRSHLRYTYSGRNVEPIEPLIKSKWGQDKPYNWLCPQINETICPTGCVATAMAQIMNYYKYPAKAMGIVKSGEEVIDLSSFDLEWGVMLDKYTDGKNGYDSISNFTDTQGLAVAKLMRACGASVYMEYGVGGSGIKPDSMPNVAYAFVNHFGYNPNLSCKYLHFYSDWEWIKIIDNELSANRPILYNGEPKEGIGGHSFIIDGRDDKGLYHLNLGWGGSYDCYYDLNHIIFYELYKEYNYSWEQSMIVGITPYFTDDGGDDFYDEDFKISESSSDVNDYVFFKMNPCCYSSSAQTFDGDEYGKFEGYVGVGLFDMNFNFIKSLAEKKTGKLRAGQSIECLGTITFSSDLFKDGSAYYIAPYVKNNKTQRLSRIRTFNGKKDWYLARTEGKKVILSSKVNIPEIYVYPKEEEVQIYSDPRDAEIYYTTDGSNPTTESNLYTSPFHLEENSTIKAIAVKDDIVSEMAQVTVSSLSSAPPVLTLNGNSLTITSMDSDAKIYYTLDGSDPTEYSQEYTGAINVNGFAHVKAIAIKPGLKDSAVDWYCVGDNQAGKLSEVLTIGNNVFVNLIISGNLNGEDFSTLSNCSPIKLDLSSSNIVSGGKPAWDASETEDNVISNNMFKEVKSLASLKLPNSATIIKSNAISNNRKLIELILPSECEVIESKAIIGNNCLKSVVIPKNVKELTAESICRNSALESVEVDKDNPYFVVKDDVLFTKNLKRLIWYFPKNNYWIYNVPKEVTEIGTWSFNGTNLQTVSLSQNLRSIHEYAFANSGSLEKVEFPSSLDIIENCAFRNCALKEIDINADTIESNAFGNNHNLVSVSLGEKVRHLSLSAFDGCESIESLEVKGSNHTYCVMNGILFNKDCSTLLKCPEAKVIKKYSIPESVKSINYSAFRNCTNIDTVLIHKNVNEIGYSAFRNSKVKEVIFEDPYNQIIFRDSLFYKCSQLTKIGLPHGLKEIPCRCFDGCSALEYLKIPETVEQILDFAFLECSNLKNIESDIVEINELYVSDYSSIRNIERDCLWIVPTGTTEAYKSQSWWKYSWRIEEKSINDIIENTIEVTPEVQSGIIYVYDLTGKLYTTLSSLSDLHELELRSGIYIINGKKILIKYFQK